MVSAFMSAAFAQDDAEAAKIQWRKAADQLRPKLPKLAAILDEGETDVPAYMAFRAPCDGSIQPWTLSKGAVDALQG